MERYNRKPSFRKAKKFEDVGFKECKRRFYRCYNELNDKRLIKIRIGIHEYDWISEIDNLRDEVKRLNLENEYWYIF